MGSGDVDEKIGRVTSYLVGWDSRRNWGFGSHIQWHECELLLHELTDVIAEKVVKLLKEKE